jgi:hypothetical protein
MAACSSIVEENEQDIEEPQSVYFPLQVGNMWAYQRTSGIGVRVDTTRVFGTSEIDEQSYFLFSRPGAPQYLRADDRGRIWRRWRGVEQPWLIFDLDDGVSYRWPNSRVGGYTVTVSRGIRIETPAGVFEDCVRLAFDVIGAVDEEFTYTFAPGVGIVHRWSPWRPDELLASYVLAGSPMN